MTGGAPRRGGGDGAQRSGVPSLPLRWIRVVVSPGTLFDALRHDPKWAGALVAGALVVTLSVYAIPGEVWQEMARARMLEAGAEVPPEMAGGGGFFRAFALVASVVFWFLWAFVLSGVVTLVFAFVLGDAVSWTQVMSGVSHALLVVALGGVVTLPLKLVRRDPAVGLSVGTFVPGAEGWLAAFLQGLDLFALWSYVILGVAVSRFAPGRSAGSAVAVLVGLSVAAAALLAFVPR